MILNQRQYSKTEKSIELLKNNILSKQKVKQNFEDKLQISIWEDRIIELSEDLKEFLKYRSQNRLIFTLDNLEKSITAARISSGITQKELAEQIGVKEQQIQRYENSNYLSASYERIIQICRVLSKNLNLLIETKYKNNIEKTIFRPVVYRNTKIIKAQQAIIERQSIVNY